MNVRAEVKCERVEQTSPQGWPRPHDVTVSVRVVVTDARRGDAVVGAIDQAFRGAREAVKTTLDGAR